MQTEAEKELTDCLMKTNLSIKVIQYAIGIISSCEKNMIQVRKETPSKDKWVYCDVIPLLTLLGVNHGPPLLHTSKTFFYINSTEERINQFSILYMINPTLHVNKLFRDQVENS